MSALYSLIQGEADVADESDDESFDEETGEVRRKANGTNGVNGHLDDSSEEEDDDDEEAARAVCAPIKLYLLSSGLTLMPFRLIDQGRLHSRGRGGTRGTSATEEGETKA